ncbi:hypothetical protein ACLPIF_21000, partial [Providencia sp. Me1]|uniref:hypothetical protein n=1 Tax=Providencia sp. Me1 TaxID=3392634 RepID=UPI003D267A02
MKNNIYIIIPVFKRVELTNQFVNSIRSINNNIKILIIDDSLGLENYNFFKELDDPSLILLKTQGDEWWCKTVNVGIDWLFDNNIPDSDIIII